MYDVYNEFTEITDYTPTLFFTVCDAFHYGVNCETSCDCQVGADYCNHLAGCICLSGWTGTKCGEDKNECDVEVSPCAGVFV